MTRLVTALVLAPGFRASADHLREVVWANGSTDRATIRQGITGLRKAVPGIPVASSRDGSWALEVARELVDVAHFRDVRDRALTQGPAERAPALRGVLHLFHPGGPLQHCPSSFADQRSTLAEEGRQAWLECLRADLARHDMAAVLEDTDRLAARWPGDQELFALRVQALARSHDTSIVKQEVGEWTGRWGRPNASLQACIASWTATRPKGRRLDGQGTLPRVPRQLPGGRRTLTGRSKERKDIKRALTRGPRHRWPVTLLCGLPGVGKSALVLATVPGFQERSFPDGTLYADLHGYTAERAERADPADVLAGFLHALGEPVPASLNDRISAYRSVLAERLVLVVLDNARDMEQLLPLLPGPGTSAAIVTSRNALRGLCDNEEALSMRINPLDNAEAAALLRKAVRAEHKAGNPAWTDQLISELVEVCEGLPLALTILASRIRQGTRSDLRQLVAEVRDHHARLDALDGIDKNQIGVRVAFDCSYRELSAPAAVLLQQLAVHPGPSISGEALTALSPVSGIAAGRAAAELESASLLSRTDERRALHRLIREYAREHAASLGEEVRARTVRQICAHTLKQVWTCDQTLVEGRDLPVPHRPELGVYEPETEREAMEFLDQEYPTACAVLGLAREWGDTRTAWLLSMALVTYQWRRHRYAEAARNLVDVLATSRDMTSASERAMIHRMVAGSYLNMDKTDAAAGQLRSAIALTERLPSEKDRTSLALSLNMLAGVRRKQGMADEARRHFLRALAVFRELDDRLDVGNALNGLARLDLDRRETAGALHHAEAAREVFEATADLSSQANVFVTLGDIRASTDALAEAAADYTSAAQLYRCLDYWARESRALRLLARVELRGGKHAEVRAALRRARELDARVRENDPAQQDRPGSR
ncbi:tetratricopeptide repeat protein [Streptomyces goshikiensis]|uniref:tetratricopeptide repeat protein n=1 Tax=Streptomyces TaxID=1883 RepID=UPI00131E4CC8|nr:tetratricopeptide repeat protein [Streptomyces sp. CB02120-2]